MRSPHRVIFLAEWAALSAAVLVLGRAPVSDQRYYLDVAGSVAAGHGFATAQGVSTAFVTPGFPLVLSVFVVLFGNHAALAYRLFQAFLLAATAWAGQDTLRLLGLSRRARVVAQIAIALHVPFVLATAEVLTETLSTLLMVSQFWLFARALCGAKEVPGRVPAGLLAALAALSCASIAVRPTALLFTLALVVLCAAAWVSRHGSRHALSTLALAALVGNALFVGAWGLRNQRELGEFVPFSTEGPWVAYSGNDFAAGGMGGLETFRREVGDARADSVFAMPELRRSHYFSEALGQELKTHAAQVPALWLRKVVRLWLNLGFPNRPSTRSLVVGTFNLVLLLLVPRGISRVRLRGGGQGSAWSAAVLVFAVILTLAHMTTFALVRYAFPALALFLALGAAAVAEPREARAASG